MQKLRGGVGGWDVDDGCVCGVTLGPYIVSRCLCVQSPAAPPRPCLTRKITIRAPRSNPSPHTHLSRYLSIVVASPLSLPPVSPPRSRGDEFVSYQPPATNEIHIRSNRSPPALVSSDWSEIRDTLDASREAQREVTGQSDGELVRDGVAPVGD